MTRVVIRGIAVSRTEAQLERELNAIAPSILPLVGLLEKSGRSERLPYTAEGCKAFNDHIRAELNTWWTKRGLAHWLPRLRLGLWLFRNAWLAGKCVAAEEKRLRAGAKKAAPRKKAKR